MVPRAWLGRVAGMISAMRLDDLPDLPVIEKARYVLERVPRWDFYAVHLLEHLIAQNLACIGIAGQFFEYVSADGRFVSQPVNYGEKGYGPETPIVCYRVRDVER